MPHIPVADLSDPRLAPYRNVRDRDLRGKLDRFIIEGLVSLSTAVAGGRFEVESVAVSEKQVGRLPDSVQDLDIFVLEQKALDAIVGFPLHRGVLAVGLRTPSVSAAALLASVRPSTAPVLVLEGLTNHDSVGSAFRNAGALGAAAVLMTSTCCDPLYRKAIRVSAAQTLCVPFCHAGDSKSLMAALAEAGYESAALCLGAETALPDWSPRERTALWLGTEGPGLKPDTIAAADVRVTIPMAQGVDSLNVATAGAVALYHVLTDRRRQTPV